MGFPLPGMQLHVVAGRGSATTTTTTTGEMHPNYATLPRLRPLNGNYAYVGGNAGGNPGVQTLSGENKADALKFLERGAPEGAAASVQSIDHKTVPSAAGAIVPIQTGPQQPGAGTNNNNVSNVFYAMNV